MAQERDEGLEVLRGIWSGRGESGVDNQQRGAPAGKVCRNMKNIGFATAAEDGSTAGPVDDDQRAAWRARLAREGKLGATTVREMLAGDGS